MNGFYLNQSWKYFTSQPDSPAHTNWIWCGCALVGSVCAGGLFSWVLFIYLQSRIAVMVRNKLIFPGWNAVGPGARRVWRSCSYFLSPRAHVSERDSFAGTKSNWKRRAARTDSSLLFYSWRWFTRWALKLHVGGEFQNNITLDQRYRPLGCIFGRNVIIYNPARTFLATGLYG